MESRASARSNARWSSSHCGGDDAVVALGGGAVTDPAIREALKQTQTVYLDVTAEEVMRRVGSAESRPLLAAHDPESLLAQRRPLYESVADLAVKTNGRDPAGVVDEIVGSLGPIVARGPRRVRVGLGSRSYDVIVGADIAGNRDLLPDHGDAEKAFVVTHSGLVEMCTPLVGALASRGLTVQTLTVPEGEDG